MKPLSNKFVLYSLKDMGFMTADGRCTKDTRLDHAALYSERICKERGIDCTDERTYLMIPISKEFVESIPFDLPDLDPNLEHTKEVDRDAALAGDFIILTDEGFYDEKYNSLTNSSHPKIRGFDLDYANLYNKEILAEQGTEWIIGPIPADMEPIVIPVSPAQQEELKKDLRFSEEEEPYGFFMKPIGPPPMEQGPGEEGENLDGEAFAKGLEGLKEENDELLPWD